jgi:hypothetical protein
MEKKCSVASPTHVLQPEANTGWCASPVQEYWTPVQSLDCSGGSSGAAATAPGLQLTCRATNPVAQAV